MQPQNDVQATTRFGDLLEQQGRERTQIRAALEALLAYLEATEKTLAPLERFGYAEKCRLARARLEITKALRSAATPTAYERFLDRRPEPEPASS